MWSAMCWSAVLTLVRRRPQMTVVKPPVHFGSFRHRRYSSKIRSYVYSPPACSEAFAVSGVANMECPRDNEDRRQTREEDIVIEENTAKYSPIHGSPYITITSRGHITDQCRGKRERKSCERVQSALASGGGGRRSQSGARLGEAARQPTRLQRGRSWRAVSVTRGQRSVRLLAKS